MAPRRRARRRTTRLASHAKVLAIDSNFEPVTRAAFQYRQRHVYPYLQSKRFALVRCQGPLARRVYVAPEALRDDVAYLTGVGHGTYPAYTGDQHDVVFAVGRYRPKEARGKIVHLLSCQTAALLGPDFVRKGCRAYFGYDENFTFYMKYRDYYFECDAHIDRALADGLTAKAAYDSVKSLFEKNIAALKARGANYAAAALRYDLNHLRAPGIDARWGDPNARL